MFARKPLPCPTCEVYRQQLVAANLRIDQLLRRLTLEPRPVAPEPVFVPMKDEDDEELSLVLRNAIGRRAEPATELYSELVEQARLYIADGLGEDEIARRILTGDWDGEESVNESADAMR